MPAFAGTHASGRAGKELELFHPTHKNWNWKECQEFQPKFIVWREMVYNKENKHSCNTLALNALPLSETQRTRFYIRTCTLVHSIIHSLVQPRMCARVTAACFGIYTPSFQPFIRFFSRKIYLPFNSSFDRKNSRLTYFKKILTWKAAHCTDY